MTEAPESDASPPEKSNDLPRRSSWGRRSLLIGVVLMVFLVVLAVPKLFDGDAIDDADLLPKPGPMIAARHNLTPRLIEIHELLAEPVDWIGVNFSVDAEDPVDGIALEQALESNSNYLAALIPLLERPHAVPVDPETFEDERPHIVPLRSAASWVNAQRGWLCLNGRTGEAVDLAVAWSGVAAKGLVHTPSLLDFLVAIAIQRDAAEQVALTACAPNVTATELERLAACFDSEVDPFDCFSQAIRHEYRVSRTMIASMGRRFGSLRRAFVFKPNRTRQLLADLTRATLASVEARDPAQLQALEKSWASGDQFQLILSGNPVGRSLVGLVTPAYTLAYERVETSKVVLGVERIRVALRRHEVERGTLPQTLDELVPDYLPREALTPGGRTLRYDPRLRWVGFQKPVDLTATPAPSIRAQTQVD